VSCAALSKLRPPLEPGTRHTNRLIRSTRTCNAQARAILSRGAGESRQEAGIWVLCAALHLLFMCRPVLGLRPVPTRWAGAAVSRSGRPSWQHGKGTEMDRDPHASAMLCWD